MQDPFEALERLARLREQGILTEGEFESEKARILERLREADGVSAKVAAPSRWEVFAFGNTRLLVAAVVVALSGGGILAALVSNDIRRERNSASPSAETLPKELRAPSANLESVLSFEDPLTCSASSALKDVMAQLAHATDAKNVAADAVVRIAGVESPFTPVVKLQDGSAAAKIAQIPLEGNWRGLRVVGVRRSSWEGGKVWSLQLRFSDPPEQTKSVLTQLGFVVGSVGQAKRGASADGDVFSGVEALDGGGSAFTCVRGGQGSASSSGTGAET